MSTAPNIIKQKDLFVLEAFMNNQKKIKHKTAVLGHNAVSGDDSTLIKTLKASLLGLLITLAVSFLLLLIGTAVAYSTADPGSLIAPVSYVALYMSAFFGGFACAKLNRRAPYLTSGLASGAFVLIGLLLSAIMSDSLSSLDSVWIGLVLRLAVILIFFVGTLLGLKRVNTPHKNRRKHH